jgi:hypothetical protein
MHYAPPGSCLVDGMRKTGYSPNVTYIRRLCIFTKYKKIYPPLLYKVHKFRGLRKNREDRTLKAAPAANRLYQPP